MMGRNHVISESPQEFMVKVYGWMSAALTVTAGIALWVASTPAIYKPILTTPLMYVIVLAQVGLVMGLSWGINRMSYAVAVTAFIAYASLVGVTCSSVLLMYTAESVATAFFITAGMFAAMSLYGYFTKADLTSLGNVLLMGIWGLMIAMLVNMWFQSPAAQYFISLVAVGIFTLLTAYDTQKIKALSQSMGYDHEARQKIAIIGALTLYLDFINLFLHMVQLFGKRRND